jgi:hypothetical protein
MVRPVKIRGKGKGGGEIAKRMIPCDACRTGMPATLEAEVAKPGNNGSGTVWLQK